MSQYFFLIDISCIEPANKSPKLKHQPPPPPIQTKSLSRFISRLNSMEDRSINSSDHANPTSTSYLVVKSLNSANNSPNTSQTNLLANITTTSSSTAHGHSYGSANNRGRFANNVRSTSVLRKSIQIFSII